MTRLPKCKVCGGPNELDVSPCVACRVSGDDEIPAKLQTRRAPAYVPTPKRKPGGGTPEWVFAVSAAIGLAVGLYLVGALGATPPFGMDEWRLVSRTLAFIAISTCVMALTKSILGDFAHTFRMTSGRSSRRRKPGAAAPAMADDAPEDAPALAGDESRIVQRLRELREHRKRIASVQQMVEREVGGAALAQVREKLEYASGVLDQQRRSHHAQLWVIALVRWQHRLARLTDAAASSAPGEAPRRLEQLAAVAREGRELLAKWEGDADTAVTREGARCIAHMRELLERCEQLRQGIVVHEAMLAIRGIAPADNVERTTGLSIEPLESLQADLGEGGSLARALAGLELEHERLRDDAKEARDVERFLGDLEGGRA